MDRRAAIAWLASTVAAGCGGGGGDAPAPVAATPAPGPSPAPAPTPAPAPAQAPAPAPAPVPTPPPAPAPAPPPAPTPSPAPAPSVAPTLSANIAMWGDSLTPPVANNLQALFFPNREVYNGGITGQTSTEIATRMLADGGAHGTWITVFWYGQNNEDDPARIKADLAASVSALAPGNSRFIILALINQALPEESRGGPIYAKIVQLDDELAALYPQNFIEIRTVLVNHYDPSNPQDVIDFANDVPPSSLRFPADSIHLNNDGSVLVAQHVANFINARGW